MWHWGKGNQFCINEGDGPPGAGVTVLNRANNGISLKNYSSKTAEQNATIFVMNHHLGNENQFCIIKT